MLIEGRVIKNRKHWPRWTLLVIIFLISLTFTLPLLISIENAQTVEQKCRETFPDPARFEQTDNVIKVMDAVSEEYIGVCYGTNEFNTNIVGHSEQRINMFLGLFANGVIKSISILNHAEVGAVSKPFLEEGGLDSKYTSTQAKLDRGYNSDIDGLTGATITTTAVFNTIKSTAPQALNTISTTPGTNKPSYSIYMMQPYSQSRKENCAQFTDSLVYEAPNGVTFSELPKKFNCTNNKIPIYYFFSPTHSASLEQNNSLKTVFADLKNYITIIDVCFDLNTGDSALCEDQYGVNRWALHQQYRQQFGVFSLPALVIGDRFLRIDAFSSATDEVNDLKTLFCSFILDSSASCPIKSFQQENYLVSTMKKELSSIGASISSHYLYNETVQDTDLSSHNQIWLVDNGVSTLFTSELSTKVKAAYDAGRSVIILSSSPSHINVFLDNLVSGIDITQSKLTLNSFTPDYFTSIGSDNIRFFLNNINTLYGGPWGIRLNVVNASGTVYNGLAIDDDKTFLAFEKTNNAKLTIIPLTLFSNANINKNDNKDLLHNIYYWATCNELYDSCSGNKECCSLNCATDPLSQNSKCLRNGYCLYDNVLEFKENAVVDGAMCSNGQWTNKKTNGTQCVNDDECQGKCLADLESQGAKRCCEYGCLYGGDCVPIFTQVREHITYCGFGGLWQPSRSEGQDCTTDFQCEYNQCFSNFVCCNTTCVEGGKCYHYGDVIGDRYCDSSFEILKDDNVVCTASFQCRDKQCQQLNNGTSVCCGANSCVFQNQCVTSGNELNSTAICDNGQIVLKKQDEEQCSIDEECLSGSCRYIQPYSICCHKNNCIDQNICYDDGTELHNRYCKKGEWGYKGADTCEEDVECTTNLCAKDFLTGKGYCCESQCVYNGVCFLESDRVSVYYCNGTDFQLQQDHYLPCEDDFQCKSGFCTTNYEGKLRCAPIFGCIYDDHVYSSNNTVNIGKKSEYCLNGKWHDCYSDIDCETEFYWCTENFTCAAPICGNNRCEKNECVGQCSDCSFEDCFKNGVCELLRGENCENSPDCVCPDSTICAPDDFRSQGPGCVEKQCGDGVCDLDGDECATGCVEDCTVEHCNNDTLCSVELGENCVNAPDDCICLESWICDLNRIDTLPNGCYAPSCGNEICDIDFDECSAGCSDCSFQECLGDAQCSFSVGNDVESCLNSQDCQCSASMFCSPTKASADEFGCYSTQCGDGICEFDETCANCAKDCKSCVEVFPSKIVVVFTADNTFTTNVRVKNNLVSQNVSVYVDYEFPLEIQYGESLLNIRPKQEIILPIRIDALEFLESGTLKGTMYFTNMSSKKSLTQIPIDAPIKTHYDVITDRKEINAYISSIDTKYVSFFIYNNGNTFTRGNIYAEGIASKITTFKPSKFDLNVGEQTRITLKMRLPQDIEEEKIEEFMVISYGKGQEKEIPLNIYVDPVNAVCGDSICIPELEDCETCFLDCNCTLDVELVRFINEIQTKPNQTHLIPFIVKNSGNVFLKNYTFAIRGVNATVINKKNIIPPNSQRKFFIKVQAQNKQDDFMFEVAISTNGTILDSVSYLMLLSELLSIQKILANHIYDVRSEIMYNRGEIFKTLHNPMLVHSSDVIDYTKEYLDNISNFEESLNYAITLAEQGLYEDSLVILNNIMTQMDRFDEKQPEFSLEKTTIRGKETLSINMLLFIAILLGTLFVVTYSRLKKKKKQYIAVMPSQYQYYNYGRMR